MHQLVVAETRKCPAHPHEDENEDDNFRKQGNGLQDGESVSFQT